MVVGGGLKITVTAGKVKVVEAPVDKAVLFCMIATLHDGSTMQLQACAMPPVIPGVPLAYFPACKDVRAISNPQLIKMVGTQNGIPTVPFLGLPANIWRESIAQSCSRERFSFVFRKALPRGIIVKHALRRIIPQLPPVHTQTGVHSVKCEYCHCTFETFNRYITECVPDFIS